MPLGVSEATLIAVLLEAVLFGAFTVLYAITLYVIVPKLGKQLNQIILAVATGMFALALSHLAIDIQRIINAFIKVTDTRGSDGYLSVPSDPLYVAQISVYTVQTILGDGFMIYRLYIVWARNKLITAPALLCFLGSIATGIGGPRAVSRASSTDLIYVAKVKHWGTAFYAITLATNFICTVLIAFRIWWIGRRSSFMSFRTRNLSPVLTIIIESGAVYSATLIAVIVTYTINDWSHYFFLDAICPVIGLVFTVIIVRIGLGVSAEETASGSSNFRKTPTRPIAVEMTHTRTMRNDTGESLELSPSGSFNNQDAKAPTSHLGD